MDQKKLAFSVGIMTFISMMIGAALVFAPKQETTPPAKVEPLISSPLPPSSISTEFQPRPSMHEDYVPKEPVTDTPSPILKPRAETKTTPKKTACKFQSGPSGPQSGWKAVRCIH